MIRKTLSTLFVLSLSISATVAESALNSFSQGREGGAKDWVFSRTITLGDLAQAVSIPIAVLLAIIPISIAARDHKKKLLREEIFRLLQDYYSGCGKIYDLLVEHQVGELASGDNLRHSRAYISARQKELQVLEAQIRSLLPKENADELELKSRNWWSDLTEIDFVTSNSRIWKPDSPNFAGIRDAHKDFCQYLTSVKIRCIHDQIAFWNCR